MTSTVFESTSVESAIKEAEKIGASPGEAHRIHELVSANTSPEIVRGFELRFGRDASDNEALWVHLVVDSDLNPSPQKISRFSDLYPDSVDCRKNSLPSARGAILLRA
jgi:hypothetical protein